ncbi:MAG: hypothetical protein H0S79_09090 [Anaerolineaceae bacterium]|nr:hypothetical protein [Anaerolineaceae bacterium]
MKSDRNQIQNDFIRSAEGIGDILVFETKRYKNKLVQSGLIKLQYFVEKLFHLQNENPEKFSDLAFNQDLIDSTEADNFSVQLRLQFHPEENLVGFYSLIDQIIRIYNAAIESQNSEISRFAIHHLNWILEYLASREGNSIFINTILGKLTQITRVAIKNNDESAYYSAIDWYIKIVFDSFGSTSKFNLMYLPLFDNFFFLTVRLIVNEAETNTFYQLVSSLIDNIHFSEQPSDIWNFGHLILESDFELYKEINRKYQIENKLRELSLLEKNIDTLDKLESWQEKFSELKYTIEKYISDENKDKASEIEEKINKFIVDRYKYNNLLNIVFAIGAYCLFKERYLYIKYLWEYKQPPDSDATWIGHDIVPNTLNLLLRYYLRIDLIDQKFHFWANHHGNRIYLKQYFVLCQLNILKQYSQDERDSIPEITKIDLSGLNVNELHRLENMVDDIVDLSSDLTKNNRLFVELGFELSNIDDLFSKKFYPYLDNVRINTKNKIEKRLKEERISQDKVNGFIDSVISGFQNNAYMREIFINFLDSFDDFSEDFELSNVDIQRYGIKTIFSKEAFFDQWFIQYGDFGHQLGSGIALTENYILLRELSNECDEESLTDFSEVLVTLPNLENYFIIAINRSYWEYFGNSKIVKPKWLDEDNAINLPGFKGWLENNNSLIPIFEIFSQDSGDLILLLDKSLIGKLVQYSPLSSALEIQFQTGIFFVSIESFSENRELLKEFISDPPEWLLEYEDDEKKRSYLETKVLIKIFERFQYKATGEKIGYKFEVNNPNSEENIFS